MLFKHIWPNCIQNAIFLCMSVQSRLCHASKERADNSPRPTKQARVASIGWIYVEYLQMPSRCKLNRKINQIKNDIAPIECLRKCIIPRQLGDMMAIRRILRLPLSLTIDFLMGVEVVLWELIVALIGWEGRLR